MCNVTPSNPAQMLRAYAVLFDMQLVGQDGELVNAHVVDVVPVQVRGPAVERAEVARLGLQSLEETWDVEQHGDFERYRMVRAKVVSVAEEWAFRPSTTAGRTR
ncbi:hypothetical protein GobsT_41000 [Gemmata obscuriglobus]|nr:hypothetical protein GobsT_41000 [Gemmata obscuriglobus]VTS08283.1 unnamed protein product [Gemmata obscuriglobus UQM 2246]